MGYHVLRVFPNGKPHVTPAITSQGIYFSSKEEREVFEANVFRLTWYLEEHVGDDGVLGYLSLPPKGSDPDGYDRVSIGGEGDEFSISPPRGYCNERVIFPRSQKKKSGVSHPAQRSQNWGDDLQKWGKK